MAASFDGTRVLTSGFDEVWGARNGVDWVPVTRKGFALMGGQAASTNFPITPNPLQKSKLGARDVVVSLLDMLPTGVSTYGTSTPGCEGDRAISVSAQPNIGNVDFGS